MKCYVFDLDGTLANLDHRLWYIKKPDPDWRGFFSAAKDDAPIEPICKLICDLANYEDGAYVVIFSGRSDECQKVTEEWLYYHEIPFEALYMRKEGDHRPDHIIKKELLDQALIDGWEPILFIDDRKQVVDMWRSLGYICLQCAPGDF